MKAYYNGEYLPIEEIKISPFDRGYLFSDGVYEAIRTYNRKLFLLDKHLDRLQYSLSELQISFGDYNKIEDICYKTAELNNIKNDFSVYLQITRGVSFPRTHNYSKDIVPNFFLCLSSIKDHIQELNNGVKVILEIDKRWARCDIKSTSLLPSIMAKQKAILNNAYDAILFKDSFITEGSHTNFFAVKDDTLYTAPLSNYILAGVTREFVIKLCNENKIVCKEEFIYLKELFEYDELFITGTTTEITPVIQIDDHIIGNGKPAKVTKKIQELFSAATNNYR